MTKSSALRFSKYGVFQERAIYIEEKLEKNGAFLERLKEYKVNCNKKKSSQILGLFRLRHQGLMLGSILTQQQAPAPPFLTSSARAPLESGKCSAAQIVCLSLVRV
jgi:hypothetical protein